jgi:hypothetical protein
MMTRHPGSGVKEGGSPARFVGAVELGPDLFGVGMLQVLEDGQRLLPRVPGLLKFAGGVPRIA